MPDPALPEPRNPDAAAGRFVFERLYRDPAGRPMRGIVDIVSRDPQRVGNTIMPASSARIEFSDGLLRAPLLPGRYLIKAQLTSVDGGSFLHDDTITVAAED